MPTLQSPCT